jgi:hypothetical protein
MLESLAGSSACDPRFEPLLADFAPSFLQIHAGTIFGMWADMTLAYTNPAWHRFAKENGASELPARWPLGRSLLDAVPDPIRPFFVENYQRCLAESRPWEHRYECSSAEAYRQFHMTAFPLPNGEGLLVVHSLVVELRHRRTEHPPLEENYRAVNGFITQCCHCRRVQRAEPSEQWDWIPEWVQAPPVKTSHGICSMCFSYYSSERQIDRGESPLPFSA